MTMVKHPAPTPIGTQRWAAPETSTALTLTRPAAPGGEYLTLRIGGEEYAIGILNVQEIRRFERPTRIPAAPAHTLGILNLRGVIVPVIDGRARLGCPTETSDATVTIVLNVGHRTIGLVVDAVADVRLLAREDIHPAPEMCSAITANYIQGVATAQEADQPARTLLLLDVPSVVSTTH